MSTKGRHRMVWGALWHSENKVDGLRECLLNEEDGLPALFSTRQEARAWIDKWYGYIKDRKDLRFEYHRYRLPKPVRVSVVVEDEDVGRVKAKLLKKMERR